jgi:hypothetical protein
LLSSAGHSEIAPHVVEMLQAGGFDASVSFGADAYQHMLEGQPASICTVTARA